MRDAEGLGLLRRAHDALSREASAAVDRGGWGQKMVDACGGCAKVASLCA